MGAIFSNMSPWATLVSQASVVVAVGAAVGVANQYGRAGTWLVAPANDQTCDAAEAVGLPMEMRPEDAAGLCPDPGVLVLDVRPPELFARGHVAGAVHLPCSAKGLDDQLSHRLADATMILVYGQDSAEARPVVVSLMQRHLADVRLIAGGYPAWEAAGLACSSGACAGCSGEHP